MIAVPGTGRAISQRVVACHAGNGNVATFAGVRMAARRKRSVAPYVALVVALIIFVPAARETALELLTPLLDLLKDLNPFRA